MGTAALTGAARGRGLLARDLAAGIAVALVVVPQALAYARVAGMPPIAGLYAAALPPLVAALLASSPYLQTGPTAITSLLTFGALAERAPVGSPEYVELGIALALVVGVIRVALGLLRGGVVAHLMSEPMLMGFVPAAALLIVASQLPAALGAPAHGGVLEAAGRAVADPAAWHWGALALTAGAAAVVLGGRRLHPWFPAVIVALAGGLLVSAAAGYGGAVVGEVPAGLPPVPALRLDALPALLLPGTVIAVVGFAEPAAIARAYATRERRRWSADRELVSQGAANLAAALSGGYPVGGSLSRSALNHAAGAATRLSGAVTGLAVLACLPFAAVLEPLPTGVLAAIVITAVLGLIRLRPLAALWRISRPQFAVACTTFALTLLLSPRIEQAVLVGIALSLAVHLVRELSLRLEVEASGGALRIRPVGVLWFATANDLHERMIGLLERHPDAQRVRLELDALGRIDLTGAMTLGHLLDDVRSAGLAVEVHGVPPQARGLLERYGARRDELR